MAVRVAWGRAKIMGLRRLRDVALVSTLAATASCGWSWEPPNLCSDETLGSAPPWAPPCLPDDDADAGSEGDDATGTGEPPECAAPRWRFDVRYQPGDWVRSGGAAYACASRTSSDGCSPCSLEPPATSALLHAAWQPVAVCEDEPPPLDRAAVDGYFSPPSAFLLPSGTTWRYSTDAPPAGWEKPNFDASLWLVGETGFFDGSTFPGDAPRTAWPRGASDLWLRSTFSLSACDIPELMLWARWDDTMEVYINGVEALRELGWTSAYRYVGLTPAARDALRTGRNTIAVHVRDSGGAKYFDLAVTRFGALADRPVSGYVQSPELDVYGEAVRRFMVEHAIPAGVLAVMKGDTVVVSQGFGWMDKAFTASVPPDAVMRLASNDKLFTRAAVQTMLDSGTIDSTTGTLLTDDTAVFPLLVEHGLQPLPNRTPDPRIAQVTLRHLLEHLGGLQELPSPQQLYADVGVTPGTSTATDNVRWVYSQPLVFTPGTTSWYSNSGYWILRYFVESVEGDLLRYLRDVVLAPVGTQDVYIASERLEDRSPREPWYATLVEPYDRWVYLENSTTLASTAEALVRLMRGYHATRGTRLIDPSTGEWAAVPDNGFSIYYGAYEGTWSMAIQRRWDEVNIAVTFNQVGAYDELYGEMMAITDGIPASAWSTEP